LTKAYQEKRKKEEEIQEILSQIDGFVLGELGIVTGRKKHIDKNRDNESILLAA
jgi:hypothetical protein